MFQKNRIFSATDLAQISRCNLAMEKRDRSVLAKLFKKHKVLPKHPEYRKFYKADESKKEVETMRFFKKDKTDKTDNSNQKTGSENNLYNSGKLGQEIHDEIDRKFKKFNKDFEKNQPKMKVKFKQKHRYIDHKKRMETLGLVILAIGLLIFVYRDKFKPILELFMSMQ